MITKQTGRSRSPAVTIATAIVARLRLQFQTDTPCDIDRIFFGMQVSCFQTAREFTPVCFFFLLFPQINFIGFFLPKSSSKLADPEQKVLWCHNDFTVI